MYLKGTKDRNLNEVLWKSIPKIWARTFTEDCITFHECNKSRSLEACDLMRKLQSDFRNCRSFVTAFRLRMSDAARSSQCERGVQHSWPQYSGDMSWLIIWVCGSVIGVALVAKIMVTMAQTAQSGSPYSGSLRAISLGCSSTSYTQLIWPDSPQHLEPVSFNMPMMSSFTLGVSHWYTMSANMTEVTVILWIQVSVNVSLGHEELCMVTLGHEELYATRFQNKISYGT